MVVIFMDLYVKLELKDCYLGVTFTSQSKLYSKACFLFLSKDRYLKFTILKLCKACISSILLPWDICDCQTLSLADPWTARQQSLQTTEAGFIVIH